MRKKIPTVTRSDPNYAASLRQHGEHPPESGTDVAPAQSTPTSTTAAAPAVASGPVVSPHRGSATQPEGRTPVEMPPRASARLVTECSPPSRKIDIRVNALSRQEAALRACGVDPAHVVRAALRRAIKGWSLSSVFAPPSEEARTRNTKWQARTSLAVDATALDGLLRRHDPLDVLSKWALIRGQVEPRVWAEIDAILAEIDKDTALQKTAQVPVNNNFRG